MTLPRTGATEWAASQASPWDTVNLALRLLDMGACRFLIEDRDLTAPPGSCSDGACYLVAAAPTGAWSGQAGKLAVAIGANASNGWQFITVAIEGVDLYIRDENLTIEYNGSAWVTVSTGSAYTDEQARDAIGAALIAGSGIAITVNDGADTITIAATASGAAVSSQTGTSYTAVLGDANSYIRFTNGSAISFTIPPNSSVAFPVGTVIEVEQAGAGALSFVAGSGVTLNSRSSDLTLAGQYAVAFAKKVATDTWTVNGDL